jgi:hypothetical protein
MAERSRRGLQVGDFWEKLAGSSIALAAVISLCRASGFDLVEPGAHSSELVPATVGDPHALPLSAYFDVPRLSAALKPQAFLDAAAWFRLVNATPNARRTAVLLVWSDFPAACRASMGNQTGLARCSASCVARVQHELQSTYSKLTAGWPIACLSASALRRSVRRGGLSVLSRYTAVTLLNFRRHDDAAPIVPGSLALRDAIVSPAAPLREAARAFLLQQGIVPGEPLWPPQPRED